MATRYWRTDGSGNWADNANWDDTSSSGAGGASYPTAADDVIFDRAYSPAATCTLGVAAACKSLDMTGASGITLAGSVEFLIYGNITFSSGTTVTHDSYLSIRGASTITSNGISIGSVINIDATGLVQLGDDLSAGGFRSSSGFNDNGHNVTVGFLYCNAAITMGSGTWTITGPDGGYAAAYFGGSSSVTCDAGNTIKFTYTGDNGTGIECYWPTFEFGTIWFAGPTYCRVYGSGGSIANLKLDGAASRDAQLLIYNSLTITGTLTLAGNSQVNRPLVRSNTIGTSRTITLTGATVTQTDVDLQDLTYSGSPTINSTRVGDCGGNTGTSCSTPKTVYLDAGTTDSSNWYDNIWSTSSGGGSCSLDNFPLPQDTAVIDNATWDDTGNTLIINDGLRVGNIDASGLTEANTIALASATYYGDLILTGSGLTVTSTSDTVTLDARVKLEASDTLDIHRNGSIGSGAITVYSYGTGATVKVLSALTHTGTFTLTQGTLDLNGQTLTSNIFSSSNSNTRTLTDSAGGGKIIVNGLTGTIFDMATTTGLTVSGNIDIQIGDSAKTLTGDVTFAGGGKAFGDFDNMKHAGDFDTIITGSNTFAAFTVETPDATYSYSDVQFTKDTTQTITSLTCDGTSSYQIDLKGTADHATLSCASGTITVTYTDVEDLQATGGATFIYGTGSTINGDTTGWSAPGGGGYAHEVGGVAPANIGKVGGVGTADIGKVGGK